MARAWAAAAAVLAFHIATMSRDLSFFDSAELALAARQGGLGHPTGQPLHTMLGWLLARIPGIDALFGVNLLSALPAALAVLPLVSIAHGLDSASGRWVSPLVAVGASVHAVSWEPATRVEVYWLASFFALWATARLQRPLRGEEAGVRWALSVGLALGLAATANPYVALVFGLALSPAIGHALLRKHLPLRAVAVIACAGLAALTLYLYVPAVAHRRDVFVWGTGDLWRYFTGADYAGRGMSNVLDHLGEWALWAGRRGALPIIALGLVGHVLLGADSGLGRAPAIIAVVLTVALIVCNAVWAPDNPDYLGYLAAPMAMAWAGAAALIGRGLHRPRMRIYALVTLLLIIAIAVASAPAVWSRTRHLDRAARMLAEGALREAPRGAIVVVESDHWVFPLLYLQHGEGQRPDVVLVAYGLASSSWYWKHLLRAHPDVRRVPLAGPGGRRGRVLRFLSANRDRVVLAENVALTAELGLPACGGGWLLRVATECAPPALGPTEAVARTVERLRDGSPSTDGVLAKVALDRGEALWRSGWPSLALDAVLAGVPLSERPRPTTLGAAEIDRALALGGELPDWRAKRAVGDPARNLYLAGSLLVAAGDAAGAGRHLSAAAEMSLPEAAELLSRSEPR